MCSINFPEEEVPSGRRQQQPKKNRDIIIEAQIELEDVLKGKELVAHID